MLNNILNSNAINTAALSVKSCGDYYESFGTAQDVSERFIQSAGSLPENNFFGMQINTDKRGKHHVYAFSGPNVKVSTERNIKYVLHS